MSHVNIIRAWKDEEYRNSLSEAERASLPENPAGLIDLGEADLDSVVGASTEYVFTCGCCNGFTVSTCFCPPWEQATHTCGGR